MVQLCSLSHSAVTVAPNTVYSLLTFIHKMHLYQVNQSVNRTVNSCQCWRCRDMMMWLYLFTVTEVTQTRLLLAVTDGAMQYQGAGVELAFPHLDQTDPLLLLQLQHRYTAVCLALKHTLRYNTCRQAHTPFKFTWIAKAKVCVVGWLSSRLDTFHSLTSQEFAY